MVKKQKTFASAAILSMADFVATTAEAIDGGKVRITVETLGAEGASVLPDLEQISLESAVDVVLKFITYRREELRKPIRTEKALSRLLKPFEARPAALRAAIEESMRQGWTGLFLRDEAKNRTATTKGGSNGGTW